MMKKQFEDIYNNNMSETVSPMCAVSRLLKYQYKDCVTVFIGPCIAKKSEAHEHNIEGNADYVLSFGEFAAMLRAKGVQLEAVNDDTQEASIYGKNFAVSGGVTAAVLKCIEEQNGNIDNITYAKASGGSECKKCLLLLKAGKLPEDFIEGMICEGGCIGGPSKHLAEHEIRKSRETLLSKADKRGVSENLKNYPIDKFSMNRNV